MTEPQRHRAVFSNEDFKPVVDTLDGVERG